MSSGTDQASGSPVLWPWRLGALAADPFRPVGGLQAARVHVRLYCRLLAARLLVAVCRLRRRRKGDAVMLQIARLPGCKKVQAAAGVLRAPLKNRALLYSEFSQSACLQPTAFGLGAARVDIPNSLLPLAGVRGILPKPHWFLSRIRNMMSPCFQHTHNCPA